LQINLIILLQKTPKDYKNIYYCWKDSYNPVVVAGYIDRQEGLLFRPAFLKGFGPEYRTVTLVNTSTVTIILCYCVIFVIVITYKIFKSRAGIACRYY
jgi:hypothetical protein